MTIEVHDIPNDPRFLPYRGWHEDYIGESDYLPALQQNRQEFMEFLALARQRECAKALQIGLGMAGGAHRMLESVIGEVWTIEVDPTLIARYREKFGPEQRLICGHSHVTATAEQAAQRAPYDLLFIDGDHCLDAVRSDHAIYAPLVRQGGIVAFHDAMQIGAPNIDVHRFIDEMIVAGVKMNVIGYTLGIAWYHRR